jgi:uncharacterized protein YbjT (DUF2867 family)
MILVSGVTGNVGGEVARALVGGGHAVRGLVRDAAGNGLAAGVEPVVGDLDRPETLPGALEGVRAVFLLPGFGDMDGVLAQIRRAGVERVVLLSGGSAGDGDMSNAISRYMIRSEAAVRESGLPWTILRPCAFMSNALRWVPQLRAGNVVRAPFAHVRDAVIDPFDIAAVAVLALLSDAHAGQVYRLSGPESLNAADRVAILAAVLGRDLRFEAQSNDEARAEMAASMPAEYVEAFFSFYVDGTLDESRVLTTVQDLTGTAPRTFEQWARAHRQAFQ